MIDIDELDDEVIGSILNNLDWYEQTEARQESMLAELRISSDRELFERYLNWHGIIGFTEMLMDALDNIRAASEESKQRAADIAALVQYSYSEEEENFRVEGEPEEHIFRVLRRLNDE